EGDVAQVQAFHELGQQAGDAVRGEVRVGAHGAPVAAEGQDGDQDAEAGTQSGEDVGPHRLVEAEAVDEHHGGTVASGVLVVDGSRAQLDLRHARASAPV